MSGMSPIESKAALRPDNTFTMSHVRRIVMEFENHHHHSRHHHQSGGFHDDHQRPASAGCWVPDDDDEGMDEELLDFYDQVPDHVMYREGGGVPHHVEMEMLRRQHSLLFRCNAWCEGKKKQIGPKPSFIKRMKSFFQSFSCSSRRR